MGFVSRRFWAGIRSKRNMKSANLDPATFWWGVFDFNDEFKTLNHWKYLEENERKPWFPRGGTGSDLRVSSAGAMQPCPPKPAATSAVPEA